MQFQPIMSQKEKWKSFYKIVRSVLFTIVVVIAFLYISLFTILSIPSCEDKIRSIAEKELSSFLGSELYIDKLSIYPFNEVLIEGVKLKEPDSDRVCARVQRLGAGISLWQLIYRQRFVITYVELLGLDCNIVQEKKDGALNINFLIEAFRPKDRTKPPTLFDLQIKNIVIRRSSVEFKRNWIEGEEKFPNLRVIRLQDINSDLTIPRLSNEQMIFDLRRLEFDADGMIKVDNINCLSEFNHGILSIRNFELLTPESEINVSDLDIPLSHPGGLEGWLKKEVSQIAVHGKKIIPSEFKFLWRPLGQLNIPFSLDALIKGNLNSLSIDRLSLMTKGTDVNSDGHFSLSFMGNALMEDKKGKIAIASAGISGLHITSTPAFNKKIVDVLRVDKSSSSNRLIEIVEALGTVNLDCNASFSGIPYDKNLRGNALVKLETSTGSLNMTGDFLRSGSVDKISLSMQTPGIDFGRLIGIKDIGRIIVNLDAETILNNALFTKKIKFSGFDSVDKILPYLSKLDVNFNLPEGQINSYIFRDVEAQIRKQGEELAVNVDSRDENFNFSLDLLSLLNGPQSKFTLSGDIIKFRPGVIRGMVEGLANNFTNEEGEKYLRGKDLILSGNIDCNLFGNSIDNLNGDVFLSGINVTDNAAGKTLHLDNLSLTAGYDVTTNDRKYSLTSDILDGEIKGIFTPSRIVPLVQDMLAEAMPELINNSKKRVGSGEDNLTFDFKLKSADIITDFFKLPFKLLYEADLHGNINGDKHTASVSLSAPYIQQGKDKLIRKTAVNASLSDASAKVGFNVVYPNKKGDLEILADVSAKDGNYLIGLDFNPEKDTSFYGRLDMEASIDAALPPVKGKEISVRIFPSILYLNNSAWDVADATLKYYNTTDGQRAEVNGFSISNGRQFLKVNGLASSSDEDKVVALLNEIDLDYVFNTLNINYVKFGGRATGQAVGSGLFSKNLKAETQNLMVKDLSYNGSVLGDGILYGNFDIVRKRVGIKADVREDNRRVALVDGGVWVGKDSLSFGIDADKVRIGFLAPFMEAFASKVDGRASGDALLYGTFSDIDMKGRLYADTISVGIAYTNVTYCGSDSVIINPGRILIPEFNLKDEYGNSARLSGELTHRYFHEPEFDFELHDADHILVFDTNENMNPLWYGRIFGSGNGRVTGKGNYVGISADMTTESNSTFTYVLSNMEEALEYHFLTFTDKRKEILEASQHVEVSITDAIVESFKKRVQEEQGPPGVFGMDIRVTITPGIQMTLIMDPVAGDKIVARGSGAMNMDYRSDSNDLRMYGKFTLEEGVYNFSLQDIILKDFIIKEGSSISFNGDPMAGLLDLRAAYRVNTNLTDLDQSFATDRDLNRTQVPVDAMLIVTGEMSHPDISFDIELPTLNDEVEQKVRSVISSDDMLNLQMIYLLALNRFYTPEYMGGTGGGEWTSVASSTISSQLSNILGQLTDKLSVAPAIRSEKGDFSDLEVDVALSSRLFNNRLLINGNLGYRDPATSTTTFVGDFDIEYLLNRAGNWRLKAYNHFNDQNYYLKSALTTQGVGFVWRRDFDHLFGKPKKKLDKDSTNVKADIKFDDLNK